MSSPYANSTLSSIIEDNLDDFLGSEIDGNDYLDFNNDSEIYPPTDMDTNSDIDTYSSEFLDENSSTVDENEDNETESSTQMESDNEADEEEIVQEPEPKRPKLEEDKTEDTESVDPYQKCPICLAAWTNVGEHRLCSLRCGHLFGHKCIKQWLTSTNPSAKKCPQCNSRASVRHIRLIYGNKLSCSDANQIEKMKKQLKECQMKLSKISRLLAKQKRKTKKYKQMYKARTLAVIEDSDLSRNFSD